jgi:hypothetical protein
MALMLCTLFVSLAGSWFDAETSVLQLTRSLLFETRRAQALRGRAETVSESMEVKKEIIDRMVAGRLHLREAIVQFQQANEIIENVDLYLVPEFRKPNDTEAVGRQVLAWLSNEIAAQPTNKNERVVPAMEKEFQELFGVSYSRRSEGPSGEPSDAQGIVSARGSY